MPNNEDHSTDWDGLRKGDKQSLFNLYNDLYFHLIRFGLKIQADDELVKDCVNQLFLNLWDKRERLSEVVHVKQYLFTILRNAILDEINYKGRMKLAIQNKTLEDDFDELSYEEILIRVQQDVELKAKLQFAIQKLTPRQMELIQLRFFDGLSYEDIAKQTSQSVKTAYNTIYDAVKALRKLLK